ncbi:MAG: hypothetical protein NVS9B7_24320 [Flavisolibacter sp.]
MLEITQVAFEKKDAALAELVIKRGKYLEGFFKDINAIIKTYVKESGEDISSSVHILSIVRNLESLVELASYLSREIIAYTYGKRTEMLAS